MTLERLLDCDIWHRSDQINELHSNLDRIMARCRCRANLSYTDLADML